MVKSVKFYTKNNPKFGKYVEYLFSWIVIIKKTFVCLTFTGEYRE